MRVLWSSPAKQDRYAIALYIAQDNVDAACALLEELDHAARRLEQFPALGREGRVEGTRELVIHKHYILVYEMAEQTLTVLAVLHSARQYPVLGREQIRP